jgi:hypothetical protein
MKSAFLSLVLSFGLASFAWAQTPPASGELVNFADMDAGALKTEEAASVSLEEEGSGKALKLTFPTSNGYPGVDFPASEGHWDLSAFRGVEADVTNRGPGKVGITLRVENPGDWRQSPWNSNVIWLEPGHNGTVAVNFGESFGKPGYALDPARVSKIKIFLNTPKQDGEILLQSLRGIAN